MAVDGTLYSQRHGRTRHTLYVPKLSSDGTGVPLELTSWIENRLVDLGGGFTRLSANGGWKGADGCVVHDDLLLYVVDLAKASPLILGSIAQRVAADLGQEVVYLTVQTLDVIHVHAVAPTPPHFDSVTAVHLKRQLARAEQ